MQILEKKVFKTSEERKKQKQRVQFIADQGLSRETKDDGMEQRKSLRWSAGGRSAGSASGWLLHGRRRKEGVGSEKQRGLLCSAS